MLKINDFKLLKKKDEGKSSLTSGEKWRFYIRYEDSTRKKDFSIIFNDNYYNNASVRDVVLCSFMDAFAYLDNSDYVSFSREFGYEDIKEAKRIYEACEKQYKRFENIFTIEEMRDLLNREEY